jgi:hypothetical protein
MILEEDNSTIQTIETQLEIYLKEMKTDFKLHMKSIDNTFLQLIDRGNNFFNEEINLTNLTNILNKKKIEDKFINNVLLNFNKNVDDQIINIIDWIIDRKYKQWKSINDFVFKRAKVSTNEDKLIGSLKSDFNFNRQVRIFLNFLKIKKKKKRYLKFKFILKKKKNLIKIKIYF